MQNNISSKYFTEYQYIEINIKGVVDTSSARDVFAHAFSMMKIHQCNKVFFDFSETLSLSTTADNFHFAKHIPEMTNHYDLKWCIYYKNDPYMYESISNIIKTLGVDRIKIIDNETIAKEWLLND